MAVRRLAGPKSPSILYPLTNEEKKGKRAGDIQLLIAWSLVPKEPEPECDPEPTLAPEPQLRWTQDRMCQTTTGKT